MASGVEMLMKACGIDPEQIKKDMQKPVDDIIAALGELTKRLQSIDSRLDRIEAKLGIVESAVTTIEQPQRRIVNG